MSKTLGCPKCGKTNCAVKDSRAGKAGTVRRRRLCASCGHRFTTYEWESNELSGLREMLSKFEAVQRHFESMAVHMAAMRPILDAIELPEDEP